MAGFTGSKKRNKDNILPNIRDFVLPYVAFSCHMLPKVAICGYYLLYIAKSCHMLPKVDICGYYLPYVAKSCHMLPKVCLFVCLFVCWFVFSCPEQLNR